MQTNPHRWFGAGQSSAADSAKAGAEAAAEAIGGRSAKAVFVFCAVGYDLPDLLAAVREEAGPDAAIVGSTTMGELGNAGMTVGGLAVAALGGDGFTVRTRAAAIDPDDPGAAGAAAAEALRGLRDPNRVLILLGDGMTGRPNEVVRGASSRIGAAWPMVGGFGADDRFERAFQLCGDEVLTGSVLGLALGSDRPIGIGTAHGWRRTEPPDDRDEEPGPHLPPRRRARSGRTAPPLRLRRDGRGVLRARPGVQPLGLSRPSGEDIRVIHAGDDEERSIWGTADVPQGALVWLMEADRQALLDGASLSCAEAIGQLDGQAALGALAFDCGGRRAGLVEGGMQEEIDAMRTALSGAPFGGFYPRARLPGCVAWGACTTSPWSPWPWPEPMRTWSTHLLTEYFTAVNAAEAKRPRSPARWSGPPRWSRPRWAPWYARAACSARTASAASSRRSACSPWPPASPCWTCRTWANCTRSPTRSAGSTPDALIVCRSGEPFLTEERQMLQGMAQVLGLGLRSIRVLAAERHLRAEKERQATTAQLRQRLVESLLTIQRAISGRRPLPEILDAVTGGAAELLHGDAKVTLLLAEGGPDRRLSVASTCGGTEGGRRTRRRRGPR